ncbi:MAG: type IV pili methyl-accepting chemotaxis transducer N-terminal domain-containing protein [Pseudomonadota bacterium]
MYIKPVSLAVVLATSLSSFAMAQDGSVQKASLVEDTGAQERINFSGKLRMLSQRIASSACHLAEGVDKEATMAMLDASTKEFDKILAALEFGDESLNIMGAETRRKTIVKIDAVKEEWTPLRDAAISMASGDISETNLNTILEGNLSLLGAAVELVPAIVGQYSNPAEIVQANAVLLDIAGRQRMLTQRISKEACMLNSGKANSEALEKMRKDIGIFEASLNALRNGLPGAGIMAPPTAAIKAELEVVYNSWKSVKPEMEKLLSGEKVTIEEETQKFNQLNVVMSEMNKVVGMYAKYAKNET